MKSPLFHLIIWLVACIAVLSGYGLWYQAVTDTSTTAVNLQNQINIRNQTSIRVAAARSALAEIAGDESVVQSYFIPETGVVLLIDDLQERARAQAAVIKVLSVATDGSAKQSTLVLLLTLTVSGSFDAVMRTVGAIEYAPYDLSISKLSLGKDAKNAWHADLQLTIGSVSARTATSTAAVPQKDISLNTP